MTSTNDQKKFVGDQSSDEQEETSSPPVAVAAKVTVDDEEGRDHQDANRQTSSSSPTTPVNENKRLLMLMACVIIVIVIIVLAVTLSSRDDDDWIDPYTPEWIDYTTGVSLVTYYGIDAKITSRLTRTTVTVEVANGKDCSSIRGITFQIPLGARVASLATITQSECIIQGQVMPLKDARTTFLDQASQGLNTAYIEEVTQDSTTHNLQVAMPPLGVSKVVVVLEQLVEQKLGNVEFAIPFAPNEQVDTIELDVTIEDLLVSMFGDNNGGTDGPTFTLDLGPDITFTPTEVTSPTDVPTTMDAIPTETEEESTNMNGTVGNRLLQDSDVAVPVLISANEDDEGMMMMATTKSSSYSLSLMDAREYNRLPTIIHGSYNPVDIPLKGYLTTDSKQTCFEHYFHPSSLQAMKRDILFVIDTSESMSEYNIDDEYGLGKTKLQYTTDAIKTFIDTTLTEEDTLTIQTFARKGTEFLWGSAKMTNEEKEDAKDFLTNLRPSNRWDSNIHEAYLEGLLRAKPSLVMSSSEQLDEEGFDDTDDTVTILVMISNNWADSGYGAETNRQVIAQDVYKLNADNQVKIFNFGFQNRADTQLLDAIAIMNGGVSKPIYERSGQSNISDQLLNYFDSEFGTVLLSDVEIIVDNTEASDTIKVHGETQNKFPLLASGYELVVRGLVGSGSGSGEAAGTATAGTALRAVTKAFTTEGSKAWETMAVTIDDDGDDDDGTATTSLCFQSYAHARITQLLRLQKVAKFVQNDNLIAKLVKLSSPCDDNKVDINGNYNIAKCIEKEALNLALEAKVVVQGLTGMVTVDDDNCLSLEGGEDDEETEETEICSEGSSSYGERYGGRGYDDYNDYDYDDAEGDSAPMYSGGGAAYDGDMAVSAPADSGAFYDEATVAPEYAMSDSGACFHTTALLWCLLILMVISMSMNLILL